MFYESLSLRPTAHSARLHREAGSRHNERGLPHVFDARASRSVGFTPYGPEPSLRPRIQIGKQLQMMSPFCRGSRGLRRVRLLGTLVMVGLSGLGCRSNSVASDTEPIVRGSDQASLPPRPPARALIRGAVRTDAHSPVGGATVISELMHDVNPAGGRCPGPRGMRLDTVTKATGEFEIPIESVGPQWDACLVLMILAPSGSGLRDTTLSGYRFLLAPPDSGSGPVVEIDVVLQAR